MACNVLMIDINFQAVLVFHIFFLVCLNVNYLGTLCVSIKKRNYPRWVLILRVLYIKGERQARMFPTSLMLHWLAFPPSQKT